MQLATDQNKECTTKREWVSDAATSTRSDANHETKNNSENKGSGKDSQTYITSLSRKETSQQRRSLFMDQCKGKKLYHTILSNDQTEGGSVIQRRQNGAAISGTSDTLFSAEQSTEGQGISYDTR